MTRQIRTKRLLLRQYKKGDEESFLANINNPKVSRWTSGIPYPYSKGDLETWQNILAKRQGKTEISFVITRENEVIGGVSLRGIRKGHKARIGYWLGEAYWGQGFMVEAIYAITKLGFEQFGLHRIEAKVFLPNKGSKRVLEKAGFRLEGLLKKEYLKDGKFIDAYLFAKVK